jgi:hypothetical protein
MQRSAWAITSAFIIACGGMTTGQFDQAGASGGVLGRGGMPAGGTTSGGTLAGGAPTGGFVSEPCRLGNSCSTPTTCVNGNIECKCQNGVWSHCVLMGAGGAGTGGFGIGAACATTCPTPGRRA